MGRLEKLKDKFADWPGSTPFPYRELCQLLNGLGYEDVTKNGGSSRRFYNVALDDLILLHEPHPGNTVKPYVVKQIRTKLVDMGLL